MSNQPTDTILAAASLSPQQEDEVQRLSEGWLKAKDLARVAVLRRF
jgi:hypothetical protein